MHILVILGHPNPASFNHALAHAVCAALEGAGHAVTFHDLAGEGFDPCMRAEEITLASAVPDLVRRHCAELRAADGIVVVHPNWWGQPPAILKGWIDRVFRPRRGLPLRRRGWWRGRAGGVARGSEGARAQYVRHAPGT